MIEQFKFLSFVKCCLILVEGKCYDNLRHYLLFKEKQLTDIIEKFEKQENSND